MGKGKKPGLLGSKWITIILVVLLIVMAGVLIWIFRTGGFDRFRPKPKPRLKPSVMNQHFNVLSDQAKLESVDSRLKVIAEFSWKKLA